MVSAAGAVQFIVFCLTLTGELGSTRKKFEDYISRSTRSMLPETQSMLLTCSVFDLQGVPLNTTAEESLSAPTNPCLLGSSVGIAGDSTGTSNIGSTVPICARRSLSSTFSSDPVVALTKAESTHKQGLGSSFNPLRRLKHTGNTILYIPRKNETISDPVP